MRFKSRMICVVACSVLATLVTGCPEPPYEPEFKVDTHGASGVAWFLGEIRAILTTGSRGENSTSSWR